MAQPPKPERIEYRGWLNAADKAEHPTEPANIVLFMWTIDDEGDYQECEPATAADLDRLGYVPRAQLEALAKAAGQLHAVMDASGPDGVKARAAAWNLLHTLALRALEPRPPNRLIVAPDKPAVKARRG